MSLSSLLIPPTGKQEIDTELDALFAVKPENKSTIVSASEPSTSKNIPKKRKVTPDVDSTAEPVKRLKASPSNTNTPAKKQPFDSSETTAQKTKKSHKIVKSEGSVKKHSGDKGKTKTTGKVDDEENSDVENAYLDARRVREDSDQSKEDDDDHVDPIPAHESLTQGGKRTSRLGPKVKFVPLDETPERRDQRTIFVGNLSVEVAQKRPLLRQLQRHILSQAPSAKIESTRFRSIPFQAPTSNPGDDADVDGTSKGKEKHKSATPTKQHARPHDLDRAATWRGRQGRDGGDNDDGKSEKREEKQYLNPNQKKKIAFINQEFHSTADTVNAYIVFAHPVPVGDRPANLPPPPEVLDPYEAARLAAVKCDGSVFMQRVIRVDLVGKGDGRGRGIHKTGEGKDEDVGLIKADPKLSVFVGNLDFASKEEDLRVFFEGVISAERGPPMGDEDNVTASGTIRKLNGWVTHVRVVRDKETQLGKGFAYIQFADHECVDEILAMEATKLKFAKRKLRVQRCKTLPGSSTSTRQATSDNTKKSAPNNSSSRRLTPAATPVVQHVVVPKGDPKLGEKLAHMPKEARKQYKSADADRVARRLAKKKARISLATGRASVKIPSKERVRVRKSSGGGDATRAKKKTSSRRG